MDDLGPQQAQRVGERREREARHQLLGDGRAADEVRAARAPACAGRPWRGTPRWSGRCGRRRRRWRRTSWRRLDARRRAVCRLPRGVEERQSSWCVARDRGVVVVQRSLEPQLGAGRGRGPGGPGRCRCAAGAPGSRRSWCSSRPASPVVVEQHRLVGQRVLVLGREAGRRRGAAGPSRPSRRRCRWSPSASVPSTSSRRIASPPTNGAVAVADAAQHPAEAELLGRHPVVRRCRRAGCCATRRRPAAARPRCAASSAPPRRTGGCRAPRPASSTASSTSTASVGGHGQLEAEVAGVAGAATA